MLKACTAYIPTGVIVESRARRCIANSRFDEIQKSATKAWDELSPKDKKAILNGKKAFNLSVLHLEGDEDSGIAPFDAVRVLREDDKPEV